MFLLSICFTKLSQVFLPILPVPNNKIFLLETSVTFFKIYCTEAKDTEVAPELISVLFFIFLLALITSLIKRSEKAFVNCVF